MPFAFSLHVDYDPTAMHLSCVPAHDDSLPSYDDSLSAHDDPVEAQHTHAFASARHI